MSNSTAQNVEAFNKFNELLEKGKTNLKGFADIDEYIDSGNLMLNALISGSLRGGYPNARSLGIAGDTGTGKTFLALNAVKGAQEGGRFVFYIDTEGALDRKDFTNFGIDLDMLKYRRIDIISDLKFYINDIIKTATTKPDIKLLVVVDSVTMLETDKQVADVDAGKNANDMGLIAKELRSLFKSFTLELSNLKIPLIFTNHIYDGTGMFAKTSVSGGKGASYAASVMLMLKKAALKDGDTKTGVICKAGIDKNRLAVPGKIEIHISFHKGMNRYVGLHELAFTFNNCGVGRGSNITEKQFLKLTPKEAAECTKYEVTKFDEKKKENITETFYFQPKAKAHNYILRESGEAVPLRQLFTNKVWTDRVIDELDKNVVIPAFKYSTIQEVLDEEINDFDRLGEEDDDFATGV